MFVVTKDADSLPPGLPWWKRRGAPPALPAAISYYSLLLGLGAIAAVVRMSIWLFLAAIGCCAIVWITAWMRAGMERGIRSPSDVPPRLD